MENTVIKVDGMSCEHCVKAVTKAVTPVPGVSAVAVDLDAGTVTITHEPGAVDMKVVAAVIEDEGYDVVA